MTNVNISRRVFIGAMAYLVTAPALAFSLDTEKNNDLKMILHPGQFFSRFELTVLNDIAELMIPKSDTAGATDAHVITVLDAMMLTWASSDTKTRFKSFVKQIQSYNTVNNEELFTEMAYAQRFRMLKDIDKQAFTDKHTELSINYRKFKEIVFHIYYTSEEANPDYLLFPGTYKGCLTKQEYNSMVNARLGRSI